MVLLLLFSGAADAQELLSPSPILQRRDSVFRVLRQAGVDTFCLYQSSCIGCRSDNETPCAVRATELVYLFWRQHNRTYRLYLGSCRLLPPAAVATALWTYFGQHQRALRTETIRPFHVRSFPRPERVHRNHGGWDEFRVILPADTIEQSIRSFDLAEHANLRGGKHRARNIYCRANRRTHIYQFLQLLQAAAQAPPVRQD